MTTRFTLRSITAPRVDQPQASRNHAPMSPRTFLVTFFAGVLATLLLATPARAQSRQVPAPAQERPIAIVNATVHPVAEGMPPILEDAHVLFVDGRIESIGTGDPPALDDLQVIDANGLHVYPGLIGGPTQIGLIETSSVRSTDDRRELGREHPEAQAWTAINPDSELIPVTRRAGILTALVFPRSTTIGAQPAAIRLDGWTIEDIAIERSLGTIVSWPITEPVTAWWMRRSAEEQMADSARQLEAIDAFFDDADAWARAREADETTPWDGRFAAVQPVLRGERPVFLDASNPGQIESAIAWALDRGMKPVILGGTAADRCVELLAEHDVPVMLRATHRLPSRRHDRYDQPFRVPQVLAEHGVTFSIGNDGSDPAHERNLGHQAATAAAYGLDPEIALASVTRMAAEIVGIDDRVGSIEEGKSATIIVTTGNPLEITTETLVAFIDGRRIDLRDRQTMMRDKYRTKYRQLGLID